MSDGADPIREAVAALRARGHIVESDRIRCRWRVDGSVWLTDGDLLAFALGIGLSNAPGRLH